MKIEKGIPAPAFGRGRRKMDFAIPFDQMEIGDSVLVTDPENKSSNLFSLVKVRAHRHGKDNARQYTTSKQEGGVRIWRTA
jgi:hypothetical protein